MNHGFMEQWWISGLRQKKCKMSLEYLVRESKVHKNFLCRKLSLQLINVEGMCLRFLNC